MLDGGRAPEAVETLSRGLEAAPHDPFLLLYSGLARIEVGETEGGLDQVRQAMAASPSNHLLHLFYARALYDCGHDEGAREQCRILEKEYPGHASAALMNWLLLARENPLAGFSGLSVSALPPDPQLAGRALLLAEQTLDPIDRPAMISAWPDTRMPWDIRTECLLPGGHANPRGRQGYWLRQCRAMQASGALDRAIVYAESAMREKPSDEGRVLLASLYFDAGRYAEVEAALRVFLPTDPERNTFVGVSQFEMGHFAGAVSSLAQAETNSARAAHALGRAQLALGRVPDAGRAFLRTVQLEESIAPDRIARAYLYLRAVAGSETGGQTAESGAEAGVQGVESEAGVEKALPAGL